MTTLDRFYEEMVSRPSPNITGGMRYEALRLASYNDWPDSSNARPIQLARAGFYNSRNERGSDRVTCFSCGISVSKWEPNDVPMEEHRKLSPSCVFLNPGDRDEADPLVSVSMRCPENLTMNEALAVLKQHKVGSGDLVQAVLQNDVEGGDSDTGNSSDEGEEDEEEDQQEPERPAQRGLVTVPPMRTAPPSRPYTGPPLLPEQATTGPINKQAGFAADGPGGDCVQAAIDSVPPTHKLSQPRPEPNSTDPRKRADFAFMDRMRSEKERRGTFYDWPEGAWQTPTALAAAGFFFTGIADRCQCAFCRGVLRNWEPNDSPLDEHRRHFGECPFVQGRNVGNLPMHRPGNRDGTQAERLPITTPAAPGITSDGTGMGIMTQRPKNPDFAIEATRVKTYDHPAWPKQNQQSPGLLAKAGFFYAGFADNVKCFFCDGGLRNWEPEDDPWQEHARWFPRCPFVRMTKGDKFIQDVQQNRLVPQGPQQRDAAIDSSTGQQNTTVYRIESKEVKARMDTETVKKVISMGYPHDLVKKVIEERLRTTGDDFQTATDLLERIFSMEESQNANRQQQQSDTSVPTAPATASVASPLQGADAPVPKQSHQQKLTESTQAKPESGEAASSKSKKKKRNKKKKNTGAASQGAATQGATAATAEPTTEEKEDRYHLNPEYQDLILQNEEMKEQRICKVCMDNDVNVVFLPCAHLVCCTNCAPALRNCPICRKLIKGTVRIFLS